MSGDPAGAATNRMTTVGQQESTGMSKRLMEVPSSGVRQHIASILLALVGTLFAFSTPAAADTPPPPTSVISPLRTEPDINGVSLTDGRKDVAMPVVLSTPADPRLVFDKVQNSAPYLSGTMNNNCVSGGCTYLSSSWSAHLGSGTSEEFECKFDDVCHSIKRTGATFTYAPLGGIHGVQEPGSGAYYAFNLEQSLSEPAGQNATGQQYASAITYPDGEVISFTYDQGGFNSLNTTVPTCSGSPTSGTCQSWFRPIRISSSTGYYITISYQYAGEDISQNPNGWQTPLQAALYAPDGTLVRRLVYNTAGAIVTDYGNNPSNIGGRTFTTSGIGYLLGSNLETSVAAIQLPAEATPELTINSASFPGVISPPISSVIRDGVTWNYAYTNPQWAVTPRNPAGFFAYDALTVTGPNGYSVTYHVTHGDYNFVTSRTDELGRVTTYSYTPYTFDGSSVDNQLTGITLPEGNSVSLVYDGCGNVVTKTTTEKPSAGVATLTESATFATGSGADGSESRCPNVNAYRATSYTDALNRVTNYQYNAGGQLTKELDPADQNGAQRLTLIQYTNSASGISRKTEVQICKASSADINTATCLGSALSHTEYTYSGNTNLPLTVTEKDEATGATRTITYAYDVAGRGTVVDGPIAGTDDAKYFQYDTYGRKIWEVGERAPNGLRLAKKFTYRDSDDKVSSVQTGTVSCVSGCDTAALSLTLLQQTDTTYDSRRYPIRELTLKGANYYTLTDRSFLDRGVADCTAVRMNIGAAAAPSATGACTLFAQGSAGADRITKNLYDNAGELLQVQKAVGTSLVENYVTYTYTPNGKQQTVTDANGNKAQLVYDGFDRLSQWQFPSKTTSGVVNTADFEQYTYDAVGNRTSLKKRDGNTIVYSYDGRNRMVLKGGSAMADIQYSYDVAGRQLTATYATSGQGITNTYNGFGELTATTSTMGGVSRTISSAYDAAGNRTQITHPDGANFTYTYDALGRLSGLYEGVGTSAPLDTFAYGTNGLVSSRAEAAGTSVGYGYDDIGRLTGHSDAFAGGTGNVSRSFAYNPASDMATETRDNNSYAFPTAQIGSVNRAYAVNGLNQYTSAGPASFTYDANGNLITDGTWTYTYDVENHLTHATGAGKDVTLSYDPLGRLYFVGGSNVGDVQFLYDGDALIEEYASTGAMTNRYVHGSNAAADDPLVWYIGSAVGSANRRYLHADHLGSIVALANGSGALTNINSYDEYGIPATTNSGRFGYTGQAYLFEIGLDYYKARMYSPTLGRFLQTDPIGYKDQINLYEYVQDDPIDHNDPTGDETGSVTCSTGACGQGTFSFSLPSLDDVTDALDALGEVANSFPDGQVVGEPLKGLSAILVVGSRDLKALKAVESAGQRAAKAEREANLAKGIPASKLGPSGKPMIHNVQHSTAKAAKEAAQREAPAGGRARFDAHPQDGNRPHFQAEDARGRNVQPVVHHCVPDSRC